MEAIATIIKNLINASSGTKVFICLMVILLGALQYLSLRLKWIIGIALFITLHVLLYFFLKQISIYSFGVHLIIYFIPSLIPMGIFYFLFPSSEKTPIKKSKFDVTLKTWKGDIKINIVRGMITVGASGAGKTEVLAHVIKHGGEQDIPGLVNDYKNFELTEMINYFYQDSNVPVYYVSPANPNKSHKVNPIHPRYIPTFADVNTLCNSLVSNLSASGENSNRFFDESVESALAGIIWRTKEDYPDLCDLPHVMSILLGKETEDICTYIKVSEYATILGKVFLESTGADEQMTAVKSTLSNILRKIVSPEIFTIFSGDDIDLRLNHPEHLGLLCVVNDPKLEQAYTPFFGVLMRCAINQMSERNRNESMLLFDEFPTLKIKNFRQVPATLRSYNVATVLGLQDKVQGAITYKEDNFRAIMANLSTKIIGKSNDPDTSTYYEKLFRLVKEETKSYSKGASFLSNAETRVNISTKEKPEHRGYEFGELEQGNFFIFDDKGSNYKRKFKKLSYTPIEANAIYNLSNKEMNDNFSKILRESRELT